MWRTDDAGQTWQSMFDQGGSSAIGAIAIAPSNPNVIYAGGGQPEPRYDVQSGRGVYRSSDGGRTWTDLGLHDTRYVGRIWVSPTDPDLVIVAAVGHFFGASDARGIYRSTDGGKTWSHPVAPGGFTGVNDIVATHGTRAPCSLRPGTLGSGRGKAISRKSPARAARSSIR